MPTSFLAAVRRLAAPLRVVQPAGWAVLASGLVLTGVGLRFDWRELVLIGLSALLLWLLALPWLAGRPGVEVGLRVEPKRVVAGHSVSTNVEVYNPGRRRQRGVLLDVPVAARFHRYDVPALAAGGHHHDGFVIRTERRGVIGVGPVKVRRGDPLGLMSRDSTWGERTEVLVRPPMVALDSLGTGLLRDLEGTTTDAVSQSDLAFHTLREYVPGDDLRHVHWRSSAKLGSAGGVGDLLVRQYLDTRRSHVTFVIDDRAASWGRRADSGQEALPTFETGLAAVASLVGRAVLDEVPATVVSGDSASVAGSGHDALDTLCRITPGRTGPAEAAATAVRVAPGTSLLVLLGGAGTDFEEMRRAAAAFGTGIRTLVLQVDPDRPSRVTEVADGGRMSVVHLAELGELPALLRWCLA